MSRTDPDARSLDGLVSRRVLALTDSIAPPRFAPGAEPAYQVVSVFDWPEMPAPGIAGLLAPYPLAMAIPWPGWAVGVPAIAYGAPPPGAGESPGPAVPPCGLLTSQQLDELDLESWLVAASFAGRSPETPDWIVRIDRVARRLLAADTPAALKSRLPALLAALVDFDALVVWDRNADALDCHLPAGLDAARVERWRQTVRDVLMALEPDRSPPEAFRLSTLQSRPTLPAGDPTHHLATAMGIGEAVVVVCRADAPFAPVERDLFSLADNLASQALHNVALLAGLEAQSEKIIRKNREIQRASRLKSNFLANTSHELKTPLHAIMGLAELLPDAASPAELAQMSDRIGANARRLLGVVNDMLDYSRLARDEPFTYAENVAIDELMRDAVDSVVDVARVKGLDLSWRNESGVSHFTSDREKLFHILINLLSNAIKFTPEGGVVLSVTADGERLYFAVVDTGIGVPPAERERIFEEFHRVKGPLQEAQEGAGLGLAIARSLARLLGGEIDVADNPGGGSIFTLRLPRVPLKVSSL